jgi:macrolide-specific efflux system membrane fusion protein
MKRFSRKVLLCAWLVAIAFSTAVESAEPPKIESVLITLLDEAEVPARVAGALARVAVREGQSVRKGDAIAQIADDEAVFEKSRAELEYQTARRHAENQVKVRFSQKSLEVAEAELRRARESVQRFKTSVSQSELDRLRLVVERTSLEIEQAKHDLAIAELTRQVKQNELEAAMLKLERHRIVAPIDGVVVEINRRRGEWIEPSETVARIVTIDRLKAQGFIDANRVTNGLQGSPVTVRVDVAGSRDLEFPGTIVFVSPEIDPVNKQVRVWAEIKNRDLLLRPGQKASMTIDRRPEP